MRRLLIVANLQHASPRIPAIARYLSQVGWDPVLLTPPVSATGFGAPPVGYDKWYTVIQTEGHSGAGPARGATGSLRAPGLSRDGWVYRSLAACRQLVRGVAHYPDLEKWWVAPAVKAAEKILENAPVDAMLTSSSPVSCHLIGARLRQAFGVPWVADLRDLWTQNHAYPYGRIRLLRERRLERATLASADGVVTVTEPMAVALGELHGRSDVRTIPNGYDGVISDGRQAVSSEFSITYTGQLYPARQDLGKVFRAVRELIAEGRLDRASVRLGFYGPSDRFLQDEAQRFGVADLVSGHGVVTPERCREEQARSQVLLLLNWEGPRERGIMTLKVFDYLAAGRPILATGGTRGNVKEQLLRETGAGEYCVTVDEIKEGLARQYLQFRVTGRASYAGRSVEVGKHSYRERARQLAAVLNEIAADMGAAEDRCTRPARSGAPGL